MTIIWDPDFRRTPFVPWFPFGARSEIHAALVNLVLPSARRSGEVGEPGFSS
jgi:hypothetical protein